MVMVRFRVNNRVNLKVMVRVTLWMGW